MEISVVGNLPAIGVRWWGHPDSVKLAISGLVRGLRAEVQLAVGPTGTQHMGLICPRAPFWVHETNDFLKTMVPIVLRGRPVWKWCNLSSAITCSYSALCLDGWNLLALFSYSTCWCLYLLVQDASLLHRGCLHVSPLFIKSHRGDIIRLGYWLIMVYLTTLSINDIIKIIIFREKHGNTHYSREILY